MSSDPFDFPPRLTHADPFQVMGLHTPTTPRRIRAAHRRLVEIYHPDRNSDPGAPDLIQRINQARDECMADPSGQGPRGSRQEERGPREHRRRGQRPPPDDEGRSRRAHRTASEAPPPEPDPVVWPQDLTRLSRANLVIPGLGNALESHGRDGLLYVGNFLVNAAALGGLGYLLVEGSSVDQELVIAAAVVVGIQTAAIWIFSSLQSKEPVALDRLLLTDRRVQLLAFGGTGLLGLAAAGAGIVGLIIAALYAACGVLACICPVVAVLMVVGAIAGPKRR